MKLAILGASGQLGSELVTEAAALGYDVLPVTHSAHDVEDGPEWLRQQGIETIVNTAAFHDLSIAEAMPFAAWAVNVPIDI
jgi:dTDP-4-dehydrorhamnose reductase